MKTLAGAFVVVVLAAVAVLVAVYSGEASGTDAGGSRAGYGSNGGANATAVAGPGAGTATAPAASGAAESGPGRHDAAGEGTRENGGGEAGESAKGPAEKAHAAGEVAVEGGASANADGGSENVVQTPEELAELKKERAEVVEAIEALVKNSAPGSEHDRMKLLAIRVYHNRHAGLAIDALERLLPEQIDAGSEWPGVSQEVVQALVVLAAKADTATLEARVLGPLVGRWQKDTWVANGNQARFDARVKDAHESVPPCWAMGPRGAALALVLAAASENLDVLLPKARLLIRELADDTSIDGAERRAAAEPWISQVMESYLTLREGAPAEQILWDLDPLNLAEFRIREYGSADGFPDWWDPEEDGEPFSERVARDWAEYCRAEDEPSAVPAMTDPLRLRPWSKRLRHHAGILSRVVAHGSPIGKAFGFGGYDSPRPVEAPAHLFNNPATLDEDALQLATQRTKDMPWPDAARSAVSDLDHSYHRSSYSREQLRLASNAALSRLLTDEAGGWPAEVRIGVLASLYQRMKNVSKTARFGMLVGPSGEYEGSVWVDTASQMSALVERLSKCPRDGTGVFDRNAVACDLLVFARATDEVLLEGCLQLMLGLQPNVESNPELYVPMELLRRLSQRAAVADGRRRHTGWEAIASQAAEYLGDRARRWDAIRASRTGWSLWLREHRSQILGVTYFCRGTPVSARISASQNVRDAMTLLARLTGEKQFGEETRRQDLDDVQLAELRLRLVFEGWDV